MTKPPLQRGFAETLPSGNGPTDRQLSKLIDQKLAAHPALRQPVASRQQEPLRATPDYGDQVKVFWRDNLGKPLRFSRGAVYHQAAETGVTLRASALPRQGDEVDQGGNLFKVATVRWSYDLKGTPTVTIYLAPHTARQGALLSPTTK